MIPGFKRNFLRWCLGVVVFAAAPAMTGCVTGRPAEPVSEKPASVFVEKITVVPDGERKTVEIASSGSVPYSAFKLLDPSRIVLDVLGMPGVDLPEGIQVGDRPIERIAVEGVGDQIPTTRITVYLEGDVDYGVVEKGNNILVSLFPQGTVSEPREPPMPPAEAPAPKTSRAEPRIFFPSGSEPLNLVRGIDFLMLEDGRSRFIVTTSGKVDYSSRRVGDREVLLSLEKCMIPDLLKREMDARYFEGAIEKAGARFLSDASRVEILLSLKEMVPYHVAQDDTEIRMDFFKTSVQPPPVSLDPVSRQEAAGVVQPTPDGSPAKVEQAEIPVAGDRPEGNSATFPADQKEYTGTPMTMEFVNADVTNILRLIGEVSNLNIIWGPEVTGTVSMRLRKVPWDQALDLVLANNDLAKEIRGNVIWVTTRAKFEEIRAGERRVVEEERRREQEKKELEPLRTEYFPVDFARAAEIKAHLDEIKTKDRGSVTVDARTNTVIMHDTADTLVEAKKIVERFDTPVKQIMIEARIVDASTDFSRDLGVEWDATYTRPRDRTSLGGSFATNAPGAWASNITFEVLRQTVRGIGFLDARLALAESEDKATVISAPRVIASNGEEAVISRGEIVFREVVTSDQIEVKELEATLSLTVTPTVSFNDFVTMKLGVTDDAFVGVDTKTEKKIETTLMVRSGETIVIGGIYTERNEEFESGIPVLRNVPVLGWLFKARTNNRVKTELLIFITPRVVETARPERRTL